jgi:Zn2+/Cd2+-exporting ATPase
MSDHKHDHEHDHVNVAAPQTGNAARPTVVPAGASVLRLNIQKMDCPTEEALIRKAIANTPGVVSLDFDLVNRVLTVNHTLTETSSIDGALDSIGMAGVPIDDKNVGS